MTNALAMPELTVTTTLTTQPVEDWRQRTRLQRHFMAVASYAMWSGLAAIGYAAGVVHLSSAGIIAALAGIIATNAVFYLLLRSGANLRFRDPALTLPQCLAGIFWGSVLIAASDEARGLMMLVYVVVLLFGMFKLERHGFAILVAFAAMSYGAVVAADWLYLGRSSALGVELLRAAALAALLAWSALFALHVGRLKARLREKNRELEQTVEQARLQAERDDLTHAYNRRYIMEALQLEKRRADRTSVPFSICIFDLDHFKTVNDQFGHLAGDRILRAFAERARSEIRSLDRLDRKQGRGAFGRYGGEEFIAVLPHTSLRGAIQCAERVRAVTADQLFEGSFQVTLSAGVAEYHIGEPIEATLRRADEAMYAAKQRGRNLVIGELPGHWATDTGPLRTAEGGS